MKGLGRRTAMRGFPRPFVFFLLNLFFPLAIYKTGVIIQIEQTNMYDSVCCPCVMHGQQPI